MSSIVRLDESSLHINTCLLDFPGEKFYSDKFNLFGKYFVGEKEGVCCDRE